jgi:hypothetical protein
MSGEAQALGELWWVEEEHRWIFFDALKNSETYAEQVEYCPACGRPLERKGLTMIGPTEGNR